MKYWPLVGQQPLITKPQVSTLDSILMHSQNASCRETPPPNLQGKATVIIIQFLD